MSEVDIEPKPAARRRLVQGTTAKLREIIFAEEPGVQIGSLPEIAQRLGVGIVTVQQAARILEHEGLLEVKRGPGGGYYGKRPDEAALERSVAAYIRTHELAYREARDIMSLLGVELVGWATACTDEALRARLRTLADQADSRDTPESRVRFEEEFAEILFEMVDKPLIALLTRVTMGVYRARPVAPVLTEEGEIAAWKLQRRRVIEAILARDEALARFEAERARHVLARGMDKAGGEG